MGTKNKHVACYLPPDLEKLVTDYAFANDYTRYDGKEPKLGSAILAMLREYCTQSDTKYNTQSDTSNAVTLKALTERIETLEAEIGTDQDRLTALLREADIINQQKLDERLAMATSPLWDDLNRLEEKINSLPLPSREEESQLEERIGITIAKLWDAIEYLGEKLEGSDRAEITIGETYTMAQIARIFGISESACYRWVKQKKEGNTFSRRGYYWEVVSLKKPQKLRAIALA